jgi:hypothetical protein
MEDRYNKRKYVTVPMQHTVNKQSHAWEEVKVMSHSYQLQKLLGKIKFGLNPSLFKFEKKGLSQVKLYIT